MARRTIVLLEPPTAGELEELVRAGDGDVLRCRVDGLAADAASVEALARLALVAHRSGSRLVLVDASPRLLALLELVGLAETLGAVSSPAGAAARTEGRSSP